MTGRIDHGLAYGDSGNIGLGQDGVEGLISAKPGLRVGDVQERFFSSLALQEGHINGSCPISLGTYSGWLSQISSG